MSATQDDHLDIVIVGAGFAGLYALHRLRSAGFAVRALDAAAGVGGTWYWNRYPGARCDVESMQYSYSFSEALEQEWSWSERYATQPEILAYLEHVADRFELRPDIQLETRVVGAAFEESEHRWLIETDRGERITARFLIMATGCLSTWQVPSFPGLAEFEGEAIHTADWPPDSVDFSGKRVGVIGTGSSGIQAIPMIATQAEHLFVFQRTPTFSVPARNAPLSPAAQEEVKAHYPELRRQARAHPGGYWFPLAESSALAVDDHERRRHYEREWEKGGVQVLLSFDDLLVDPDANATLAEFVRDKIREIVADEEVASLLTPAGFPIGAKRLCVDTDYYRTFNRENVSLVDVAAAPIEAITPTGLCTAADEYELDAIVFATGFDAGTGALLGIDIRGRDGTSLREYWRDGPRSYLGLQVAGFPNLFSLAGPGSPSALTNMVAAIEQHVEWVGDLLEHAREHGFTNIEVDTVAEEGWDDQLRRVAEETIFPRANSWYLGANIPGKPRVFMFYAGGLGSYRDLCDRIAAQGYDGFKMRADDSDASPSDAPDRAAR
jgi:cyclohexanone monooxygenase